MQPAPDQLPKLCVPSALAPSATSVPASTVQLAPSHGLPRAEAVTVPPPLVVAATTTRGTYCATQATSAVVGVTVVIGWSPQPALQPVKREPSMAGAVRVTDCPLSTLQPPPAQSALGSALAAVTVPDGALPETRKRRTQSAVQVVSPVTPRSVKASVAALHAPQPRKRQPGARSLDDSVTSPPASRLQLAPAQSLPGLVEVA